MRADQMQRAAGAIVALLKESEILDIVRQCRVPVSEQKHARLAKLGHASAVLMEATENLDPHARKVLTELHLDSLTSPGYWRGLLAETTDDKTRQVELVRLYSRVLFATNHLPSLMNLLSNVTDVPAQYAKDGEKTMVITLSDAGEKASDPDRLARVIDGIDMLYSACATLAKKPAIDLQLISVTGRASRREITFLGDDEAIQAVITIIESIPDAIADLDPDEGIDIQFLVQSLPIFEDLKVLQKLGTYSLTDLQDIRDTMHQGVLLAIESGAVLGEAEDGVEGDPSHKQNAQQRGAASKSASLKPVRNMPELPASEPSEPPNPTPNPPSQNTATSAEKSQQYDLSEAQPSAAKDEYYDQYLRERERLQSGDDDEPDQPESNKASDKRGNAIDSLLRSLKK